MELIYKLACLFCVFALGTSQTGISEYRLVEDSDNTDLSTSTSYVSTSSSESSTQSFEEEAGIYLFVEVEPWWTFNTTDLVESLVSFLWSLETAAYERQVFDLDDSYWEETTTATPYCSPEMLSQLPLPLSIPFEDGLNLPGGPSLELTYTIAFAMQSLVSVDIACSDLVDDAILLYFSTDDQADIASKELEDVTELILTYEGLEVVFDNQVDDAVQQNFLLVELALVVVLILTVLGTAIICCMSCRNKKTSQEYQLVSNIDDVDKFFPTKQATTSYYV